MEAKKTKVNREFKDGMFRTLFNDKEKMLELYNAVSDEPLGKEAVEDIETLTLETPLFIGSRNDIAFSINGKTMFFCEHQSTYSGNMALRMATYFGKTIDTMFGKEIFGSKKLIIPPPEFNVMYIGRQKTPEVEVFKLSDHYGGETAENSIEIVVNAYNICYNKNKKILQKSKTLREYSLFIDYVNENLDKGMTLEDAVEITVERAKSEGILVDFLNRYGTEVAGMLRGITVEEYGEVMKKEGFEDGKAAREIEMAKALKDKGVDLDIIAETSGLSKEEIEAL